ncbi:DUF2075 domain-containing protein [Spiroplasma eriocheiris]|uniref:ATP-binding protein n=1 Tax=Spiroplasma eriocheiris TaxID=315358 RepID=A0A0H3XI30_9MOLU|nr:DUF2075 domain-containing protein [Spiroplasma eriocheiris]AHF58047.1 putative ATP/GTP-binding protein [Spiroplasma eriocheiris CCTCC M 207170]AKM54488.1 ATP-binding protein [Spiroplasma eriocheiris]
MIIYKATKDKFLEEIKNQSITNIIYTHFLDKKVHVNHKELISWSNSLYQVAEVLIMSDIPGNTGIAIEYMVPYTDKRVDFIISGYNDKEQSVGIIMELKQWEYLEQVNNKDGIVKTYLAGKLRETVHPSYQAWSYVDIMNSFCSAVEERNITLKPISFLHNYELKDVYDPVLDVIYKWYLEYAPVFTKHDKDKLANFIKENIKYGDEGDIIWQIENGKIKPSKFLQESLKSMIENNPEFTLIGNQKVVFEQAKLMFNETMKDNKKRILIVKGGPGTGKSVLAIMFLNYVIQKGKLGKYISKNSAPREVYKFKLKGDHTIKNIDGLFSGSSSLHTFTTNYFDTLIIDEAHRLQEKSGLYANKGENQTKEAINASLFTIFFIDEKQKISLTDNGQILEIEEFANIYNAEIKKMTLTSQFRCNGSDGYLNWIDKVLYNKEMKDEDDNYSFASDYDFQIIDSPSELMKIIKEKNKSNNKSRIVAGYCWDWNSQNDPSAYDIKIGDFIAQWNFKSSEPWAIGQNSVNQIGSIHTSQGLEFEYVGVIIGDDLKYKNNQLIVDFKKRAKNDKTVRGLKKIEKEDPHLAYEKAKEIILNTYRTFLTRGQKGCYVYCTNLDLSNYLKAELNKIKS